MTVYLKDLKNPAESKLSNAKLWVLFIGLDVWVGTIAVSYRITKCRVSRVSKSSQDIPLPVTTGLFEIDIFVSWSFPQSYHSHSWVRQTYLHSLELAEFSFTMSNWLEPNPFGKKTPTWTWSLTLTGLATSMTVNALMTGLIVFRIFKIVFRQVRPTSDERKLGATGGRQIYSIMAIIIESGMILFSIQLVRFVVTVVETNTADYTFQIVVPIHESLLWL